MLDVESVELDSISPWEGIWLKEVLDLVIVDVESQNLVRGFSHELLTEVRTDETSSSNHTYRQWLYLIPVQIYSRCYRRRHFRFLLFLSLKKILFFFSLLWRLKMMMNVLTCTEGVKDTERFLGLRRGK